MSGNIGEAPATEFEMLRGTVSQLQSRLPIGWKAYFSEGLQGIRSESNEVLEVISPGGQKCTLGLLVKHIVELRDVPRLVEDATKMTSLSSIENILVVSRYLPASVREALSSRNISYLDFTGNLRIETRSPDMYICDRGSNNNPWKKPGRPMGTLRGEPAAKVVRALLDYAGPWKIRELVELSESATGSVYRVVEFLERENLITKDEASRYAVRDWQKLLLRWSQDYGFLSTNKTSTWIAPRGIDGLLEMLGQEDQKDYVATGSCATSSWETVSPTRLATFYVSDPEYFAQKYNLRPAPEGANVVLVKPAFKVLVEGASNNNDGLRVAAPTQVVADLLGSPGRGPTEAEALMDWMAAHEQLWRKS